MSFSYEFPRPALAVDCVVFGFELAVKGLKVLLVQRNSGNGRGVWSLSLPGGFVQIDETVDEAARRELRAQTGLHQVFMEQLYTFSQIDHDPRERVVTVAYFALVNLADERVQAATSARHAAWFGVHDVPDLAFDHAHILALAVQRLRGKIRYQPIGFELLPAKFTLTQLQKLYEIILEVKLDKRNFRKKIHSMKILTQLDEVEQDVSHRAARLYRFDFRNYQKRQLTGFDFQI